MLRRPPRCNLYPEVFPGCEFWRGDRQSSFLILPPSARATPHIEGCGRHPRRGLAGGDNFQQLKHSLDR